MGEWIVDVLSFKKIFSLCGLKGHIGEIRGGVTLVDNGRRRTTECEDRARNLETDFAKRTKHHRIGVKNMYIQQLHDDVR